MAQQKLEINTGSNQDSLDNIIYADQKEVARRVADMKKDAGKNQTLMRQISLDALTALSFVGTKIPNPITEGVGWTATGLLVLSYLNGPQVEVGRKPGDILTGRGSTTRDLMGYPVYSSLDSFGDPSQQPSFDPQTVGDAFDSIKKAIDLADESMKNFKTNFIDHFSEVVSTAETSSKILISQLGDVQKTIAATEEARQAANAASAAAVYGPANPLSSDGSVAARARGGPVFLGQSYLVGENGPELFSPGRSGYISTGAESSTTRNVTVNLGGIQITSTTAHGVTADVADQIVKKVRQNLLRELQLTRLGSHL